MVIFDGPSPFTLSENFNHLFLISMFSVSEISKRLPEVLGVVKCSRAGRGGTEQSGLITSPRIGQDEVPYCSLL